VDYKFQPPLLTVSVGTTVKWVNKDVAPHTATRNASDEAFDSGRMGPGAVFEHTFHAPGTYGYLCWLHQGMQGRVVVQ